MQHGGRPGLLLRRGATLPTRRGWPPVALLGVRLPPLVLPELRAVGPVSLLLVLLWPLLTAARHLVAPALH